MINKPLVSVIIPSWNGAAVLEEALRSAQTQSYRHFEVIIVDDGSTDDTAKIAGRFCESDARFRLLHQANAGVSVARNTAMEQARGEFIAFLDADDVWMPGKLARQIPLFREDSRTNLVFTNFFAWDGEQDLAHRYRSDKPLPEGDAMPRLIRSCLYLTSTVIVPRQFLSLAGGFDPELREAQDWDLFLRLGEHGLRARGIREPLARYRRWPGNRTGQKLKFAVAAVRVLEKNLGATQRPALRPAYRRSLSFARAKLELARARYRIETEPDTVPPAILRAWRLCPKRVEWLLWYLLAAWPDALGGCATAAMVHRKMLQKY
jgi:glycosyltransferase involved in cell wall biosynthesis